MLSPPGWSAVSLEPVADIPTERSRWRLWSSVTSVEPRGCRRGADEEEVPGCIIDFMILPHVPLLLLKLFSLLTKEEVCVGECVCVCVGVTWV